MKIKSIAVIILIFSLCVANIGFAADITFTVGSVSGAKDEVVDVPVTIAGNPGIASFGLILTCDSTVVTPVSVAGGIWTGDIIFNSNYGVGQVMCAGASSSNKTGDGVFFTLKFKITDDKKPSSIVLTVNDLTTINGTEQSPISSSVVNGGVNLSLSTPTPEMTATPAPIATPTPVATATPTPISPGNHSGGGGGGGGGAYVPAITPQPTQSAGGFKDLDNVQWAQESINALAKAGIISGRNKDSFDPQSTVTRAEFTKIMVGAFGLSGKSTKVFEDVNPTDWFYQYIQTALDAGIVSGMDQNSFAPNQNITREQAVTIIYRAIKLKNITLQAVNPNVRFEDTPSQWAAEASANLSAAGLINGKGEGLFAPTDNMTRAEAAKVIYGVYKLIKN